MQPDQTPAPTADISSLRDSLRLLSGFLDQLPLAFYYSKRQNDRWVIEFLSDGITALLGYEKEKIIGKSFEEFNMDKDFYRGIPIHSKNQTSEFSVLYTLRTARNIPKRVIDKGLLLFDEAGRLQGAAGVLMDFTLQPGFDIFPYLPVPSQPLKAVKVSLGEIIGYSHPMRKLIENILKIAPTHAHVLIQGESGTGKELAARAIHETSGFNGSPFIALNCGAISEHLIESEFFGHVKGAFSGATENRQGYLDVVNNGTLFLDEVGEMPVHMQIKLLRVLDGYGYAPVGSTKIKNSTFRLICATNRDLGSSVTAGIMRLDFYHRIKQLTITMPPLRDHIEDIDPLIDSFAEKYFQDNRLSPPMEGAFMPPGVRAKFRAYHWPGNVRELHHAVIKYLSMGEVDFMSGPPVAPPLRHDLTDWAFPRTEVHYGSENIIGNFAGYERSQLLKALNSCGWDTAKAAGLLGKTRRTIQRKIAKYSLK